MSDPFQSKSLNVVIFYGEAASLKKDYGDSNIPSDATVFS